MNGLNEQEKLNWNENKHANVILAYGNEDEKKEKNLMKRKLNEQKQNEFKR